MGAAEGGDGWGFELRQELVDWWAAAPKWEPELESEPGLGKSGAGGGWSPSADPKSPASGVQQMLGSGADRPGLRVLVSPALRWQLRCVVGSPPG